MFASAVMESIQKQYKFSDCHSVKLCQMDKYKREKERERETVRVMPQKTTDMLSFLNIYVMYTCM
jgi:hypothetical protein